MRLTMLHIIGTFCFILNTSINSDLSFLNQPNPAPPGYFAAAGIFLMTGKYRQVCRGEHCSPVAFTRQVDLPGRLQRAVNDRPYGLTRDFYSPVGRGDPTPPGKAFPLGGRWRETRRMREKYPEVAPSSVTCGDSFPQRGKPMLPLYPPRTAAR